MTAPGTADTEIFTHLAERSREAVEKQTADMVKLRPEDIADAVVYLASSDFVTGQIIAVDGGRLLV